jgi:hypothetical protein
MTTFHHFRQWSVYTTGLTLFGLLRSPPEAMSGRVKGPRLHPQIGR